MKIMLVRIVITIALLLPLIAHSSEEPQWLLDVIKQKNPNELAYYSSAGEKCPVSAEEADEIIKGVFIRSRIKPLKNGFTTTKQLYISAVLSCFRHGESEFYSYNVAVDFGIYNPKPAVIYDHPFGTFGYGKKNFMIQTYKESVELAVTAFIKSNFDL